jgi:hypothetical protein
VTKELRVDYLDKGIPGGTQGPMADVVYCTLVKGKDGKVSLNVCSLVTVGVETVEKQRKCVAAMVSDAIQLQESDDLRDF